MKRVLITGVHSYIGDSFGKFVSQWPDKYTVDKIDLRSKEWDQADFSKYDSIYHVTGIAHRKETAENAHEYFEVNRDLAVAVAKKAKAEGVKQFIFLSSGTIYGIETGVITKETPINAKTNYGKSKAEAEEELRTLNDESFHVAHSWRHLPPGSMRCHPGYYDCPDSGRECPTEASQISPDPPHHPPNG